MRLPIVAAVVLSSLPLGGAACEPPLPNEQDAGDASVSVEHDGELTDFLYDPDASHVTLTPPVEGLVEIAYLYQDPPMGMTVTIDSTTVDAGTRVPFPLEPPLDDDALRVVVETDAGHFDSAIGASGFVDLDVLDIDEGAARAVVSVSFEVTLANDDGDEVSVVGFIESSVGTQ